MGKRDVRLGSLGVALETGEDGTFYVRSTEKLPAYPARLTERLDHWAYRRPGGIFLAERGADGNWRRITYGEMQDRVRRVAGGLLNRGLSPGRPLAVLSANSIDHAVLGLAAMRIGVPYAPLSPTYSLVARDFKKLRAIVELLTPGAVFADDGTAFSDAISATCPGDAEIITVRGDVSGRRTTRLADLATSDLALADAAHNDVGPDTIAKILFTSGSTGHPKGVITTQRMLCANQAMLRHWLAFLEDEPPVLLDWLPWNHTFGGSHNFGLALYNGGTLFIDAGRPTEDGFAETLRNLRDVAPNIYFNVPKGYEQLVAALKHDATLRENYFRNLKLNFYSAASLPLHIRKDLDELAIATVGAPVPMVTGFGSTETAPAALVPCLEIAKPGNVGIPLPGVELKLAPAAGKLEARLRGPSIMPGYWRDAGQSSKAFDSEGFYRLGDAFRFMDENGQPPNPALGFAFDGRISEDFKLATGTWVRVGQLRAAVIDAFAPFVRNVVIAGHERDTVTVLAFPDADAIFKATGHAPIAPEVRQIFAGRLAALAARSTGSSTHVSRMIILTEPPSIEAGEITDKGSINQRNVLEHRAGLVADLYSDAPPEHVIAL